MTLMLLPLFACTGEDPAPEDSSPVEADTDADTDTDFIGDASDLGSLEGHVQAAL